MLCGSSDKNVRKRFYNCKRPKCGHGSLGQSGETVTCKILEIREAEVVEVVLWVQRPWQAEKSDLRKHCSCPREAPAPQRLLTKGNGEKTTKCLGKIGGASEGPCSGGSQLVPPRKLRAKIRATRSTRRGRWQVSD